MSLLASPVVLFILASGVIVLGAWVGANQRNKR
ncbi:hypothetical protein GGQ97_000868 [Sphingomonas kaistensis]|uniref:Uncharacterized protein n=1 Tax=Sphingomonas kaistensis TaxID=298708 RepID=A0A7X6BG47_9SPHN|nr:hypothetical protein [Sphingomonas kaistensis]